MNGRKNKKTLDNVPYLVYNKYNKKKNDTTKTGGYITMKNYMKNYAVEPIEDKDIVVFAASGEPAMSKDEYLTLIHREMENWWEDADDDEREDFGTFENFVERETESWIAEDQQYTFLDAWKEAHEEH